MNKMKSLFFAGLALGVLALPVAASAGSVGMPKFIWHSGTSITVLGNAVQLSGFRFDGNYSRINAPEKSFASGDSVWDYTTSVAGFSNPNVSSSTPSCWVAVMAAAGASDANASIKFVPFLKIVNYDSGSGVATFDSVAGNATPDFFKGADVQVITQNGFYSNTVVQASGNSVNTMTLPAGLKLTAGDYILPAPGAGVDFGVIHAIKVDYSPNIASKFEWRNFSIAGNEVCSETGNVHSSITNSERFEKYSFTDYVSPIATGIVCSMRAITTSAGYTGGTYIYASHDSSNHIIAYSGSDQAGINGQGGASNALLAFGAGQFMFFRVSGHGTVKGNVYLNGWIE